VEVLLPPEAFDALQAAHLERRPGQSAPAWWGKLAMLGLKTVREADLLDI